MEEVTTQEFFIDKPPGIECVLSDISIESQPYYTEINFPNFFYKCATVECKGETVFTQIDSVRKEQYQFAQFKCKNCEAFSKTFALRISQVEKILTFEKLGESPPFGEKLPNKFLRLFNKENQVLLLKGRQCESQNFGIGAFTYYRRVVENQKNEIIDLLIRTIQNTSEDEDIIRKLNGAKTEIQYLKAINSIASFLPTSFFIKGHNPFKILHIWLSFDIHNSNDEEALTNAHHIRLLLTQLVQKMAELNKEDKELNEAITGAMKKRNQKKSLNS